MHNGIVEKVLAATDIVNVISERVALVRSGREYKGLCPFHADTRPSMTVSPIKQIFKCFSCGAGGDAIKFVRLSQPGLEFRGALAQLAEKAGISLTDDPQEAAATRKREELRRILEWARERFCEHLLGDSGRAAREYAARRGLTAETLERFRLGLAPESWDWLLSAARRARIAADGLLEAGLVTRNQEGRVYDRFRNRLLFPILDARGRCVAFGGRTLGDDPAKYLNSPESPLFSKSRILYAFDAARAEMAQRGEALVVEGYMDAVLLHQHGFTHACATLGTSLTDAHVKLLRQQCRRLYLCFDSDTAGVAAANRAAEIAVRSEMDVRVVVIGHGKDPADVLVSHGASALNDNLQSAGDALEFKWRLLSGSLGKGDAVGRRSAIEQFMRFVASAGAAGGLDPLTQGVLVGRLAELLRLPSAEIYEWLARSRRNAAPGPANSVVEPGDGQSARYDHQVSQVPTGLVTAVEALLGLVLSGGARLEAVYSALSAAVGYCGAWRQLLYRMEEVQAAGHAPTIEALLAASDEPLLLELIACVTRESGGADAPQGADADDLASEVAQRVRGELDLLRLAGARQGLAGAPEDAAALFEACLRMGRSHNGVLPPARSTGAAARVGRSSKD